MTNDQKPHRVTIRVGNEFVTDVEFPNRRIANDYALNLYRKRISGKISATGVLQIWGPDEDDPTCRELVEVDLLFRDDQTFDSMLVGHELGSASVLKVYADKCSRRNIKELPGIYLVGNTAESWAGAGGLGAIWITEEWSGMNRDDLIVDANPSWVRFVSDLLDILYTRVPRVEIVMFYWS